MVIRRILCIDGGGIRGIYAAAYLARLEELTGTRVVDHFDLIAGTSTGGIIALALSLGFPAGAVLDLYLKHGEAIFPSSRGLASLARKIRWVLSPKYSALPLANVLHATFGSTKLGEAQCRVCIPAYNATVGREWVFKTAHHPDLTNDYRLKVADIAMATSAAPTYFPPWRDQPSGALYLDGGIWANNPAIVAITEAQGILNWPMNQLRMLSLGTTYQTPDWRHNTSPGGIASWGRKGAMVDLMMGRQVNTAHHVARLCLRDRYLRVNPVVPAGRFSLDRPEGAEQLVAYGEAEARHTLAGVTQLFLSDHKEPFVPCYALERAQTSGASV